MSKTCLQAVDHGLAEVLQASRADLQVVCPCLAGFPASGSGLEAWSGQHSCPEVSWADSPGAEA